MRAYRTGDHAAFKELFRRYAPALHGMLRRQCRSEDAQDLVQQTFLHFHRARLDWKEGAPVRPWLFTIALNVRREAWRRKGRRRETTLDAEPAARTTNAAQLLEAREDVDRLHEGLDALPAAQREVIELHWLHGVGFPEIATIVGASLSAVKVRAHRGYERLRELLVVLFLLVVLGAGCTPLLYEGQRDLAIEPVSMRLVRITEAGLVPPGPFDLREGEASIGFLNDTRDETVAVVISGHVLPALRCSYTNRFESDAKDTFSTPLLPGAVASLCLHTDGDIPFAVRGLAGGPARGLLRVRR